MLNFWGGKRNHVQKNSCRPTFDPRGWCQSIFTQLIFPARCGPFLRCLQCVFERFMFDELYSQTTILLQSLSDSRRERKSFKNCDLKCENSDQQGCHHHHHHHHHHYYVIRLIHSHPMYIKNHPNLQFKLLKPAFHAGTLNSPTYCTCELSKNGAGFPMCHGDRQPTPSRPRTPPPEIMV